LAVNSAAVVDAAPWIIGGEETVRWITQMSLSIKYAEISAV
jgi:hypothetical protein